MLISASTSGGLAQKLIDEYQADRSRIVHLLGVAPPDARFKDSCIYFHSRGPETTKPKEIGQSNAAIEIRTEEFLVSQGLPRPVRITNDHVSQVGATYLHKPFYRRAFRFGQSNISNPYHGYSPFSMSNDIDPVDKSLHTWVRKKLIHELPASVRTLLYVDDMMAKVVANWISKALGEHVVAKPLEQLDPNTEDKGPQNTFVVIAHDDPDLENLTHASIALRHLPKAHRHYVLCYGFPPSRAEHERRRFDLRMSPHDTSYGWSEFLVLPVGATLLHESFSQHRRSITPSALRSRRDALGQDLYEALLRHCSPNTVDSDLLFFPGTSGEPLALRQNSIFLPKSTSDGVSQFAVYATVSSAVQAAREPRQQRTQTTNGFDENPFVRSVLDPSMFARFNDGILQASLLRTVQRSELDYSASDDLSRQFASICATVLIDHENPIGDAAIEFLYALATEKISLRSGDRERLEKKITESQVLNVVWNLFRTEDPVVDHLGT